MVQVSTTRERATGAPDPGLEARDLNLAGARGLNLRATARGRADAAPALLLHGFGQSRHAWRATGNALASAGYYALAPDARGHGESDFAPDGDYAVDDFVADARRILDRLDAPVVVGASIGGMVGMLAEAEGRDPVARALVLVDIVPRWNPDGVQRILDFMGARPDGFDSLDEVAAAIADYLPHRNRDRALTGLRPYLRETPDGRWVWHWDPRLLAIAEADTAPYHDRFMAAARRITCPTLLITGARSDVVDAEAADEFLDAVPHAEHVRVEGARHMVAGDANDAFTRTVLEFIEHLP